MSNGRRRRFRRGGLKWIWIRDLRSLRTWTKVTRRGGSPSCSLSAVRRQRSSILRRPLAAAYAHGPQRSAWWSTESGIAFHLGRGRSRQPPYLHPSTGKEGGGHRSPSDCLGLRHSVLGACRLMLPPHGEIETPRLLLPARPPGSLRFLRRTLAAPDSRRSRPRGDRQVPCPAVRTSRRILRASPYRAGLNGASGLRQGLPLRAIGRRGAHDRHCSPTALVRPSASNIALERAS